MEDGNWFLYAAMIVIAFVSWVFNKIQEATAARRRGEEIQQHREERDQERHYLDEQDENPTLADDEFVRQTEKEQAPPPPLPTTAEDAMRKLVEALGGTPVKAPQPPPPREIQVPAVAAAKPEKPRLSAAEQAALERLKKREREQPVRGKRGKANLGAMSIADLVRDPEGIRKAVILREILDRPRSERPWE